MSATYKTIALTLLMSMMAAVSAATIKDDGSYNRVEAKRLSRAVSTIATKDDGSYDRVEMSRLLRSGTAPASFEAGAGRGSSESYCVISRAVSKNC